eukprot:70712_1
MAQQLPNQGQVGGQGPLPANVPPLVPPVPPLPELPIFAPQVPYNQGGGVPPAGAVPQAQGQLAGLLAQIQHIQGLGAVAGQPPPPAMPAPLGQPLAAVQPPAAAAVPANPWAQLAGLLQRQIPRVGGAQLGFGQFIPPQAVGLGSVEQMCRTGQFVELCDVVASEAGASEKDPKKVRMSTSFTVIQSVLRVFQFGVEGLVTLGANPTVIIDWVKGGVTHIMSVIEHLKVHDLQRVILYDAMVRKSASESRMSWGRAASAMSGTFVWTNRQSRPFRGGFGRGMRGRSFSRQRFPQSRNGPSKRARSHSPPRKSTGMCDYVRRHEACPFFEQSGTCRFFGH